MELKALSQATKQLIQPDKIILNGIERELLYMLFQEKKEYR